jgi:phosphatidylserine/phosphatidylglycerophosphate/cardiolipin synthase-like enzyme
VTCELSPLHALSTVNLRALAGSLREGQLAFGVSPAAIMQLLGPGRDDVCVCLQRLVATGMAPAHCALLIEAITEERDRAPDLAKLFELVLSGPDVAGVPTEDTAAVVNSLFMEARTEVLVVSYAVFNGEIIFETLAARMRENPDLKVTLCLDIARQYGDTWLSAEIVRRFAAEFRQRHWPWPELPELYYDPRALSENTEQRASLHAKAVVVDRCSALVTSANFTGAAQRRNIELGMLIRHPSLAKRIADYFEGLCVSGTLARCPFSP